MRIVFEVPGQPVGKQRPRVTRRGITYTPKATRDAEAAIRAVAARHFDKPLEGPVALDIVFIFEPARSWSKKKVAAHLWRPHTQRPDCDNAVKLANDALNGIAYADDSQVCQITARKIWGREAKTVIAVEAHNAGF